MGPSQCNSAMQCIPTWPTHPVADSPTAFTRQQPGGWVANVNQCLLSTVWTLTALAFYPSIRYSLRSFNPILHVAYLDGGYAITFSSKELARFFKGWLAHYKLPRLRAATLSCLSQATVNVHPFVRYRDALV